MKPFWFTKFFIAGFQTYQYSKSVSLVKCIPDAVTVARITRRNIWGGVRLHSLHNALVISAKTTSVSEILLDLCPQGRAIGNKIYFSFVFLWGFSEEILLARNMWNDGYITKWLNNL